MPDILKPYILTADFAKRIKDKILLVGGLNNIDWQDEDFEDIRSSIRSHYRTAQNFKCAYCKNPVSIVSASNCQVEHIVPKSKHFEFIFEPKNLCVICADCNVIKRSQETLNEFPNVTVKQSIKRYPHTSNAFKIVHPHFDNYDDHISICNGYYLDHSKKGGYTIVYCRLNRKLHEIGYEIPNFKDIDVIELMNKYLSEDDALQKNNILKRFRHMLIFT